MLVASLSPAVRWAGILPSASRASVDTLAPARPATSDLPTRAALQALCAPVSREAFFERANGLFAGKRPVRELSWDFAHHPDPAVRQAFRIASQELGRSAMSEMERQERVNGGYEALQFLLAHDPEEVEDGRVSEIIARLPAGDLSDRFRLRMAEQVPCKAHLFQLDLPSQGTGRPYGVRDGVQLRGPAAVDDGTLATLPDVLAEAPHGRLEAVIEQMADPALRPQFEARKEAWLGLADRWEERGIDDRFGWNGVYGLELYAAMATHFPDWKPEERIGPLLAQNQVNQGKGLEWLRTLPLQEGQMAGRARFQLMEGRELTAAQKDELLSWFHPLHQGMIHLPWDWSGCRREALSCLAAALPQLEGCTLPDGRGGRLPVREALREHLLDGPDTDVTLTFEDDPADLMAVLEHPELEAKLLAEVPAELGSWTAMPQRARNAVALLALRGSSALDERMAPLVGRHQGRQEKFVVPYRARAVAGMVSRGEMAPLVEMARDRRLRAELIGHAPPADAAVRAAAAGTLADRMAVNTPEFDLATALVPTFAELGEPVEKVVLADPRALTPELREVFADRLAAGVHSNERRRVAVARLLGAEGLDAWRTGASGWVGDVCRRLPASADVLAGVESLLGEDDPGAVASALLDRIQAETLLSDSGQDAALFAARAAELARLRARGKGLHEALEAVAPARVAAPGGIEVRGDAVIVGGTQLRVRR